MKVYSFARILYHATHVDNIASIFENGLSPDYATGKRKAIWFVPKAFIQSGILHAASRHNWHVSEMTVVTIAVDSDHVRFSGNGMMFYSEHSATAESHAPAAHFLDETEGE
jgi:hypothetical protein